MGFVDQGYTGEEGDGAAEMQKIELSIVKLPAVKRGVVLLP